VSRTEVDALSFEDQARQARAEIDDAQAAGLCAAALVLWRGLPFGDAAECSMLDDEAARLEELRIAVVEHAHVRRLAAGAGVELIADLSQLVKEHPLREGLWSSLILAQYRAGQQAEALRTYERLRSNFADVHEARYLIGLCRSSGVARRDTQRSGGPGLEQATAA
jgi:DNA-binding SARP family transcriptional activator